MKNLLHILIILLVSLPLRGADEIITVAFLNLERLYLSTSGERDQASEILRAELIKSEYLKFVESDQIEKLEREIRFQESGLSEEMMINIGKRLDADYLLVGSFSRDEKNVVVSVRLIGARTGENLNAWNLFTPEELLIHDLPELADSISSAMLSMSMGNTVANIQRLVDRDEFVEAARRFSHYSRTNQSTEGLSRIGADISRGLAAYHFELSVQALTRGAIKEAYFHAGESVRNEPDNEKYRRQYADTIERRNSIKKAEYLATCAEADDTASGGDYSRARKLLDRYVAAEGARLLDDRYFSLSAKIQKGLNVQRCDDARAALDEIPSFLGFRSLDNERFIYFSTRLGEAKTKVIQVLTEHPDYGRAYALLDDINDSLESVYRSYHESSARDDYSEFIAANRWQFSLSTFSQKIGTASSPVSPAGTLAGFGIEWMLRHKLNDQTILLAPATLGFARDRQSRTAGGETYKVDFYSLGFMLGLLPGYRWDEYAVCGGLLVRSGYIRRTAVLAGSDNQMTPVVSSLNFGAGLELRGEWHITRDIVAFLSLEYLPSLGIGTPDMSITQFSIGAGYIL